MKRMTSSNYNPCVNCIYSSSCSHIKYNAPVCPERARYDRLAAIEDILGDEYDLDRLRELAQADREGRCMVLPCDPGQVVWAVNVFGVTSHQIRMLVRDKDGDFACSMLKFPFEDFGRKVFLTRAEAEEALRRLRREQDG